METTLIGMEARSCEVGPKFEYLEVVRAGTGGTVVVVVGNPEPMDCCLPVLPRSTGLWWLKLDGFFAVIPYIRPVGEIVAAYAEEIARIHRGGPLILVGYSFGGLIAADLAERLQAGGTVVKSVLLEPPVPGILPTRAKQRKSGRVSLPPPLGAESEGWLARARGHWQVFRSLTALGRAHYFCYRLCSQARYWCKRGKEALAGYYRERHLRPWLESRLARGGSLPWRYRDWWYFLPQVQNATLRYAPPAYSTPVCLAGTAEWLNGAGSTWRCLLQAETEVCELPLAAHHVEIISRKGGAPWAKVVRRWLAES